MTKDSQDSLDYQRRLLCRTGVVAEPSLPEDRIALIRGRKVHYLDWGRARTVGAFLARQRLERALLGSPTSPIARHARDTRRG